MAKSPYTPMMMQYLEIKDQHPDTLILFRLGDFYELFFEDAKIASKELELVLTGKDAGSTERVPMCGMPYHAVNTYIEKLIKRGYKVGIVEQLEDPALAKGLVKRDVVQIITPGTLMDVGLQANTNNYVGAIDDFGSFYVLAFCDLSTGELGVTTCEHDSDTLENEINLLEIKELVVDPKLLKATSFAIRFNPLLTFSPHQVPEVTLEYEPLLTHIQDIRLMQTMVRLIDYLVSTQKRSITYLQEGKIVQSTKYLQMDTFTRLNLELTRTIRSEDRYGSLVWLIDFTKTAMGARLLKANIIRPLADPLAIEARYLMVEAFVTHFMVRHDLGQLLNTVYDLERLVGRIGYGNANGRDLVQLATSLRQIPFIMDQIQQLQLTNLDVWMGVLSPLPEVVSLIDRSMVSNPPFTLKEGGLIKEGYDASLDELRELARGGKQWIADFELREKERSGIKNLKVGYNKVFGFYIEITRGNLSQVTPELGYERKQTLTGAERFITQELKEKEEQVLHAEEQMLRKEYDLFISIRDTIKSSIGAIQANAKTIAFIDMIRGFADAAVTYQWVRPMLQESHTLDIKEGRHPVLEKIIGHATYVPNDVQLNEGDRQMLLITGPNMGGKSTYMRQVALLVVMAQIGSFVPAKSAKVPVYDRIFTRIGASDDLVSGQSTFMVEMMEANHALRQATPSSLILFDEIGRGTSTFDGMALAQAIIEYLQMHVHAHTLFSTHYHELTELEKQLQGIKNIHVRVHEQDNQVTFLYKIADGPANKSYGINVARLAHLPEELLVRAKDILHQLESRQISSTPVSYVVQTKVEDPSWLVELKTIDPLTLSPMDALNYLYELKKKMK